MSSPLCKGGDEKRWCWPTKATDAFNCFYGTDAPAWVWDSHPRAPALLLTYSSCSFDHLFCTGCESLGPLSPWAQSLDAGGEKTPRHCLLHKQGLGELGSVGRHESPPQPASISDEPSTISSPGGGHQEQTNWKGLVTASFEVHIWKICWAVWSQTCHDLAILRGSLNNPLLPPAESSRSTERCLLPLNTSHSLLCC